MSSKRIDADEHKWLWEAGYIIREYWIGPLEGSEYVLCRMGESDLDAIVTRKSERACYNHANKQAAKEA